MRSIEVVEDYSAYDNANNLTHFLQASSLQSFLFKNKEIDKDDLSQFLKTEMKKNKNSLYSLVYNEYCLSKE